MRSVAFIVTCLSLLCIVSCRSPQEKLEQRISETISAYMSENLPADVHVDSVRILHIDSLSDYHYPLFVEKPVAEDYADRLNLQYNAWPEDGSTEELEQRQRIGDRITVVVNRLEALDRQLADPRTDSTNLKCFFAAVRVYLKKGNQALEPEYYGFPVTPDFRVLESEMVDE